MNHATPFRELIKFFVLYKGDVIDEEDLDELRRARDDYLSGQPKDAKWDLFDAAIDVVAFPRPVDHDDFEANARRNLAYDRLVAGFLPHYRGETDPDIRALCAFFTDDPRFTSAVALRRH